MKADKKDMGRRIKKARLGKGLTQEQLAEMIDTSITHISHIENSKGNASIDTVIAIMNALDLMPDELFCGVVNTAKPQLMKETADILDKFSVERVRLLNQQLELELELGERKDAGEKGKASDPVHR
ncbi:MAG: helix-turn-helix transcriptional regulator [Eubacteriaceae bacterium]|nr:helix-turn-helix transcriptional regulator [Eubacteriaceae bacterium]